MAKLCIKNGHVIDPASGRDEIADLLIDDGRIVECGPGLDAFGAEVFDATGAVVSPGFIDMHVHLREPGFEHAETIETGGRAAAAGGFTSICCMPNTLPVNDNATVTSYIIERARSHAVVNVFPIGAITKGSAGEQLAEIGSMKAAGIVAISDDGKPVMNARVVRRAMEFARVHNLPLIQHCEDLDLSTDGVMHEGLHSVRLGLRAIPAASEDVMVARDILLAELTGARYHVAHISSRHAVNMVAFAKSRNLPVSCEVTPHHISLTDGNVSGYDSHFKMKPPLRAADHVAAVVGGVVEGTVDAIATDHAPHAGSEKMQEFERCPFGVTGLETALGLCMDQLVHSRLISLPRLVALFTTGPAGILGLDRGSLAPGSVADVTIFDPDLDWTYDAGKSLSKSNNSPFDGRRFRGGPVATIVRGSIIWRRQDR
jgi:dihydroorotase